MPQDAIIKHGDFSAPYEIEAPRLTERTRDLDTVVLTYAAPTDDAFVRNTDAPAPWNAFTIEDIEREQDADEYLYTLQCRGVYGSAERLIGKMLPRRQQGDWDTVDFEWITRNANRYQVGQTLTGGTWLAMICTDVVPEHLIGDWMRLRVSGKGLARPKQPERRITCNGMTISGDAVTWRLPNGWNTAQKGVVDLPQIVVEDTYWTTAPPPTNQVPGSRVPPNTPPLANLGNVTFASSSATRYWPNGWKFTCSGEQLASSTLWKNTLVYTVQWAALPSS